MYQPSVSWNIIPLKFFNWNIICFREKEPISVKFFRLLSAPIKVYSTPHAIFQTTRSGFIQFSRHCSFSWKITPLHFCSSNLVYFGQNETTENKFSDFWKVAWKFTKFLIIIFVINCYIWNHHFSVSWQITLLYFYG